jgi:non-lysosomal glucosylceramidase
VRDDAFAGTRLYEGETLRNVAMPLGGIGTGHVAVCGDGGLRQWQLLGRPNHRASLPDSLFVLRASCVEPPADVVRVLQSEEPARPGPASAPLVTDGELPRWQRELLDRFRGVARTTFQAVYPIARVHYLDEELPIQVSLEAWNPLVPLDADASGLPVAAFRFSLSNPGPEEIHGCLAASIQNAVGWDGYAEIEGNRSPLYGGNVNRVKLLDGATAILMENPTLSEDEPRFGQMLLAAAGALALPYERFTRTDELLGFVAGANLGPSMPWRTTGEYLRTLRRGNTPAVTQGPSAPGETWNGALAVPYRLAPGDSCDVSFLLAWYFPNRVVDFDQFGPARDYGKSVFWLGNEYAQRFSDVEEVAAHVRANLIQLGEASNRWARSFTESSLPNWLAEAMAAQAAFIRSPTCFRTDDGTFFGFEGSLGASTSMWNADRGGSCPLNCSHVWNYEQALSRLFPRLEQTMRETELEVVQAPEGYIPHRALVPLYLRQLWEEPIGGPERPALDGMLGCPLKVYREVRQGAGRDWLARLWPRVVRLMDYVIATWDPDEDGVLRGEQPTTYDISFYGANVYIGGLWLAALRAFEQLALLMEDPACADRARTFFHRGSTNYDELLWNGDYYVQEETEADYEIGTGCLADQLLGQWWAHQLDLGYVLPAEHVDTTLRSIVKHNFRRGFHGFEHSYRIFADGSDSGVLMCTWPHGGRPAVPVRYCDEVWTGTEYQVAAHCLMEGLVDEGLELLEAVRRRYDGTRRNPFNEIECGDHYARAMAGWSVLEAISGWRYNAVDNSVHVGSPAAGPRCRMPVLAGTGWGEIDLRRDAATTTLAVSCHGGQIWIGRVAIADGQAGTISAKLGSRQLQVTAADRNEPGKMAISFPEPALIEPGEHLEITAHTPAALAQPRTRDRRPYSGLLPWRPSGHKGPAN